MITPGRLDLTVQRWTPTYVRGAFVGFDFTDAEFLLEARMFRDAPGDPVLSLTNADAGDEGISVTVTTDDDDIPTSVVLIQIDEETGEGILLNAGKAGADVSLPYDLVIDNGGIPKFRALEGALIIRPGSAQ